MPKLFLSYRRTDAKYVADSIQKQLTDAFGDDSVFRDVDSIPKGFDFRKVIHDEVSRCDVLLAVIGDGWLDARCTDGPHAGQRRLDDPEDWVRIELETALKRNIPVIPVIVDNAQLPRKEHLPASLKELVYRNASFVRPTPDLDHDLEQLVKDLRKLFKRGSASEAKAVSTRMPERIGRYDVKKLSARAHSDGCFWLMTATGIAASRIERLPFAFSTTSGFPDTRPRRQLSNSRVV
jgi:hypothetical protein